MSVLLHKDCFNIPLAYWPSRWKREEDSQSHELEFVNSTLINNDEAVTDVIDLVQCPPTSKTKGRPKEKRLKGGIESTKQVRACRLCRGNSHNFSTCSERLTLGNNDAASIRANKKKKILLENQDLNPIFTLKF